MHVWFRLMFLLVFPSQKLGGILNGTKHVPNKNKYHMQSDAAIYILVCNEEGGGGCVCVCEKQNADYIYINCKNTSYTREPQQ